MFIPSIPASIAAVPLRLAAWDAIIVAGSISNNGQEPVVSIGSDLNRSVSGHCSNTFTKAAACSAALAA